MSRTVALIALFAAAFTIAAIVFLPARAAFDLAARPAGVGAELVHGPVWNAELHGVNAAGVRLERVEAGLRAWPLLTGTARLDVSARGDGVVADGQVDARRGGLVLIDAAGTAGLDRLPGGAGLPAGGSQTVSFEIDRLAFDRQDGCVEAQGRVRSAALVAIGRTYDVDLPALAGTLACAGPRLAVDYDGESAALSLTGRLRLGADSWALDATARAGERRVEPVLIALGFEQAGGAWTLRTEGAYR
mgnify:CR=1 FL=1